MVEEELSFKSSSRVFRLEDRVIKFGEYEQLKGQYDAMIEIGEECELGIIDNEWYLEMEYIDAYDIDIFLCYIPHNKDILMQNFQEFKKYIEKHQISKLDNVLIDKNMKFYIVDIRLEDRNKTDENLQALENRIFN